MAKKIDIPSFGPLSGVNVVHASMSIAGPFAAALMADLGANVIWIENPKGNDVARTGPGSLSQVDRRNQRSITLDISSKEGKEVFLKLMKNTDIFIEASRTGQYEKWGLTDEVLWDTNPKLVISHISGFGQYGDKKFTSRSSYDPIAQAFGGLMYMNGRPNMRAFPAEVSIADYYSGFFAAFSSLAAYINVGKTGKGESIDISQYESILRCQSGWPLDNWNKTSRVFKQGMGNNNIAGFNSYKCKDGNEIYIVILGFGVVQAALPIFGFQYGSEDFPSLAGSYSMSTPGGEKLENSIVEFCAARTSYEVDEILSKAGVPCSVILKHEMMLEHPHYISRESITKWTTVDGKEVIGQNITPKLKNYPGEIWRGCPTVGMDTNDILEDMGFDQELIKDLFKKGIISR